MYTAAAVIKRERAICIFEQDTGRPITRHTGLQDGEHGAVKGYILTIRSISTVAKFAMLIHGTIEVRVSASGYLQGAYWEPAQSDYGTRIREHSMGSVHDHVINFKVDLDIAGTSNSLRHTYTVQEEVTHPWFDDDWGQTVLQQRIVHKYIENENDALLKYSENFRGEYSIVNRERTNQWGVVRGYAIRPGYSPIYNTVVGSKRMLNNANWARYNLAVSLRKDSEPSSSSVWNLNLPIDPVVDFHKFFDGENLTQQDLVAWINSVCRTRRPISNFDQPQAEDSPNTRTNIATSSFFLTPLNYFDADVSIESANAVLLTASSDPSLPYHVEEYGVTQPLCLPEEPQPLNHPRLRGYTLEPWQQADTTETGEATTESLHETHPVHGGELRRVGNGKRVEVSLG
ncbi:hypothetical protein EIP86_011186 [Pleurotus ostreatoroseus]|nr:hypothetical protein EIP86_011186 [Pleurotus ostreatoroseus]